MSQTKKEDFFESDPSFDTPNDYVQLHRYQQALLLDLAQLNHDQGTLISPRTVVERVANEFGLDEIQTLMYAEIGYWLRLDRYHALLGKEVCDEVQDRISEEFAQHIESVTRSIAKRQTEIDDLERLWQA